MSVNEQIKQLISKLDEVGKTPDYKCGGKYSNYIEYGRLRDAILDLCLSAFREGRIFTDGPEE